MGMSLEAGGHLTHGWGVSVTGKWFRAVRYGVRRDTGTVDLDEVRALALRERPKLIWCGGTAIPRTIDFAGFAQVASEVGAVLAADVAHVAGLIAGGVHPSPVGHADVIATTTHKTLRGPRGAMLMSPAVHAQAIDRAVFPGLQGGPHDHTTAAIAVALHEAAQPSFATYARAVVGQRPRARRRAARARLRPRLGRHRQPPAARRPDRQGRSAGARRPRRSSAPASSSTTTRSRSTRASRLTRPASGSGRPR